MSRIGRNPIPVPEGVKVDINNNNVVVEGPNGRLELDANPEMRVTVEEGEIWVERPSDGFEHRALHGLTRSLVKNMVTGVTTGYEKRLRIAGVGYRAALKGKDLELQLGFSHSVTVNAPEGIEFEVPSATQIAVKGIDKQQVGQIAADIRDLRPPEPYKGKGISYEGERIRRKVGKRA